MVNENKELYLCGDFNFDLLKFNTDSLSQKFFNLLCSYGLMPTILQPTRVTDHSATVIDNIFTNNISDSIISGNILLTLSEHFSQFMTVRREKIELKNINNYKRDYSQFSTASFRDDISIQNWNLSLDNANQAFNDFYFRLDGAVNRHAPMKKMSMKEIKNNSKPWLTSDIQKLIKKRDRFFAKKKSQPDNINLKKKYNELRNKVQRDIKKSKKQYYADYFSENINNIKKTWEGIRKIVNIKKSGTSTTQLKIGGKIVDNEEEIATNFNDFFVNVGPSTDESIPVAPGMSANRFLKDRIETNFIIAHISNDEIIDIINKLENKSTGPSGIPLRLLSLIPDLIIIPLAHIINLSFSTGEFPNLLKIVKVIPIHKGGSTQDMNNYRPISLLSIFDEIIEKNSSVVRKHQTCGTSLMISHNLS